uniref:Pannexin 1 n=1 Tax=Felis catus TaxID=9685 RepID=A0ABI7XNQ6_FELCA
MAIAHLATEYVFSDFLLKEPSEPKFKGLRLELAVDKMVTCIAVGLPLLLISLAFAQEISIGTQISCFSPSSFSWRQAAFVDSYCWAAVQQKDSLQGDSGHLPLWLHKGPLGKVAANIPFGCWSIRKPSDDSFWGCWLQQSCWDRFLGVLTGPHSARKGRHTT